MSTTIHQRIEQARAGTNPTCICRVPSGWVVLADMQFLRGYTILLADPVVGSLNDLDREKRVEYLRDMAIIGDALLEVTGAFRINYAILGNSDPVLHAHIVPRYENEPEVLRKGLPWSYPQELVDSIRFDVQRDGELMEQLRRAIQKRL
jgi:diadenosine tetraphosphate (Ap4A) HIT family hydrolase